MVLRNVTLPIMTGAVRVSSPAFSLMVWLPVHNSMRRVIITERDHSARFTAGRVSPQPGRPATRGADADRALRWDDHRSRSAGPPGEPPERRSEQAGELRSIHRDPGTNNWQRRHKWLREDDYMSLPVLRPRRSSCIGRPEVASSVGKSCGKRGVRCCAASVLEARRLSSKPLFV